jgi:D-inositol-3-phosphate glycosyltransferase
VDGSTGLLVPPRCPERLAAALSTLISDPALRTRMGAAGRARVVAAYDWREIARKTEINYRRIIRSAASRPARRAVAP